MDEQWVERLVEENRSALLAYFRRHVSGREDAEDLLQEVFLSCYRHRESFDPARCSEKAWLYVIAKNRLRQYYRDTKQTVSLDEMSENGAEPADSAAQEAAGLMECRDAVARLLNERPEPVIFLLDERSRTVLVLRYFEGLDSQQVAERMGLSPVNVRVIQSRALNALREQAEQMHLR